MLVVSLLGQEEEGHRRHSAEEEVGVARTRPDQVPMAAAAAGGCSSRARRRRTDLAVAGSRTRH